MYARPQRILHRLGDEPAVVFAQVRGDREIESALEEPARYRELTLGFGRAFEPRGLIKLRAEDGASLNTLVGEPLAHGTHLLMAKRQREAERRGIKLRGEDWHQDLRLGGK